MANFIVLTSFSTIEKTCSGMCWKIIFSIHKRGFIGVRPCLSPTKKDTECNIKEIVHSSAVSVKSRVRIRVCLFAL